MLIEKFGTRSGNNAQSQIILFVKNYPKVQNLTAKIYMLLETTERKEFKMSWIDVCDAEDVDLEDVIRFDVAERTFAVYRAADGDVFATDGLCTHEQVHLADGLVIDDTIECPKHNGRFNYQTGAALRAPVCDALATYPARLTNGRIEIKVPDR
jgi:3-phenylpropionate/trans-cinnamate dioxygenase ferredoxin subunit|tara:strand:+ start:236 stop:697 length:462 start_codon:yes stop_codon:yes gene_type:complete